jgi:hypothetical protein
VSRRCVYCDQGNLPREVNGKYEHWIVVKLSPPTMKVRDCKALKVSIPKYDGPLVGEITS